ncbi:hypothetical protein QJS10_CPA07g00612 [Acorus calamus]|uniref:Uncharacterized protein n=1 Tax=Acorus calamus TaxID=4465 RepID=A0AAV9EG08_ACOCL|nr:hypothetical protein QJS10_CPA07g00612 [Acorus calamus]
MVVRGGAGCSRGGGGRNRDGRKGRLEGGGTLKRRLSDLTGILVFSQHLISGTIDIRDETLVPLVPPPDASGFPLTLHLLLCLPGLKGRFR